MFRNVDIAFRVVITGALASVAIWSLVGDGPIAATWLAAKLILFALIVMCGIGIRVSLPPIRDAISEIFLKGSTPEREAALAATRGSMGLYVKGIWLLIAVIIWVSVAKP